MKRGLPYDIGAVSQRPGGIMSAEAHHPNASDIWLWFFFICFVIVLVGIGLLAVFTYNVDAPEPKPGGGGGHGMILPTEQKYLPYYA